MMEEDEGGELITQHAPPTGLAPALRKETPVKRGGSSKRQAIGPLYMYRDVELTSSSEQYPASSSDASFLDFPSTNRVESLYIFPIERSTKVSSSTRHSRRPRLSTTHRR